MNFSKEYDYPVMLSICVPTYNHEKYIRQALESIFMQKTQYTYEILVGEDKSTDNTRAVLKEIEKEGHPELKVFYRENNMNDTDYWNAIDLMDRARGKYLIFLEGDDYWIDESKIDTQIDFLEKNIDYIAVSHNCIVVDKDSNPLKIEYNQCKDNIYTIEHYACEILPGQTATIMMRNFFYFPSLDTSLIRKKLMPGDRKVMFTLISYGKIWCIQKSMSAYRYIARDGESWSSVHNYSFKETKQWYEEQLEYSLKVNNSNSVIVADYMLYAAIRQALILFRVISIKQFYKEIKSIKDIRKCRSLMFRRDINRYLLRKKMFFPKIS